MGADGRLAPLAVEPDSRAAALFTLGRIRFESVERVRARFDAVIRAFPESPQPFCYRGELALWAGRWADARADFEHAIGMSSTPPRWAFIGQGAVRLFEGSARGALELWEAHADEELGPGPTLYAYRGDAKRVTGDTAGALADLLHACEVDPTRIGAWVSLALAHADAGERAAHDTVVRRLFGIAPGLLADAAVEIDADRIEIATRPSPDAARPLLEQVLHMMRGNRSSTCCSYFTREGELRFVPLDARAASHARSEAERLESAFEALRRARFMS